SLLKAMCQDDTKTRPSMDEVVARFEKIRLGMSEWKLRSRIARKNKSFGKGVSKFVVHWARQLVPIFWRIPAIPSS
ncbi:hypothetical protein DFH09DRAFT_938161, partial [Mycena vulgaris]